MKNILLLSVILLFISCEESSTGSEKTDVSVSEPAQEQILIDYAELPRNTQYESACYIDDRYGYQKIKLKTRNDSAQLTVIYSDESDCLSGGDMDRLYVYYDMYADGLELDRTDYTLMTNGVDSACDLGDISLGIPYGIDGIGCELSFEDVEIEITINDAGNYVLNGIELIKM